MNKFCFRAIYNGRLWEKELCVSALKGTDYLPLVAFIFKKAEKQF